MKAFELSESFADFYEIYPAPKDFVQVAKHATFKEKHGIARLWLSEGIPYAFKNYPILYETIREWLASKIDIHPKEITLIGSARIGYCLARPSEFGKPFNAKLDFDFSAISEKLFNQCVEAFRSWSEDYSKKVVSPKNRKENFFWDRNLEIVPKNIDRGFIDTHKIPLRDMYPIAQKIRQAMWILQEKLKQTANAPIASKMSIRVYMDWHAFIRQLEINLTYAINAI